MDLAQSASIQLSPVLHCAGVSKRFSGVVALSSVDLTVERGEILGLIGPNGSGKSTLLNIISGIYRADSGTITFEAQRVDRMAPHSLARIGISRTFQNLRLYDALSPLDNLLIGMHTDFLTSAGSPWSWIGSTIGWPAARRREKSARKEASIVLEKLRLTEMAHRPVKALSYGQKKRLELARATLTKPILLLLDEPTAGLSPDEATEMMHTLHDLRLESGVTMVVIEHRLEWVMDLADRVAVLDSGKKTADGLPTEVAHDPNVIAAYLGYSP